MNEFEKQLQNHFRESEEQLPPGVSTRLRAIREEAVAVETESVFHRLRWPVTGMAMASIVALVVTFSPGEKPQQRGLTVDSPAPSADLDFYYWLAETQTFNGS